LGVSLLTLCLAIGALPLNAISALAVSPDVVISQVYGGGGNSGATLKNDFIELYNRGATQIDVTGWSVQYASAAGTAWLVTQLSGSIGAGKYYLVKEAAGAGGTVELPFANATGNIAMSATSGKVALVRGNTALVSGSGCPFAANVADFLGYGTTANCAEGTRTNSLSNTTAALRNGAGAIDTDDNGADFTVATPNPRNTPPPGDAAPSVASTSPANGASGADRDASITIGFSEPVSVAPGWYSIACATSGIHAATQSGGPSVYMIDPVVDFAGSESCTVIVTAENVTDADTNDPPDSMLVNYMFTFTTVAPPTLIREIQGTSHISPKVNTSVSSVPGVVTARRSNGFWMQDAAPDADDSTSEGIFVFTSTAPIATLVPGVTVKVSGTVTEFRPGGASSSGLTLTQITGPTVTITGLASLPAPVIIGAAGRRPPVTVIENDSAGNLELSNTFDPVEDGIDFYESLEGMLVGVSAPVAVSRTTRFSGSGEIWVVGDGGAAATTRSARGAIVISPGDFNPERILVDDELFKFTGPMPDVNVGATFAAATLSGLMDYAFGNYRIQLLAAPIVASDTLTREVTEPATKNELSVATFNVENLDANDPQSKFDELAGLIVTNLAAPDILALEEIQDDNGPLNDGTVTAVATIARLVAAITAVGGPTYDWRSVDPENNTDGGQPGGNIRVGFLFRTDGYVQFIDRPGATAMTANTVLGQHSSTRLAYSPGRVAPADPAWSTSRKPLAAEFKFRGEQLFIIANHFNSKGGDQPLFGRTQPPVLVSEIQRLQQAQVLHDFVAEILAADPKANVVVLGDINDFQFSAPMSRLKGDLLHVLIDTLPPSERYSYVFDGNGQALDHILVSAALFSQPFEYDIVHVNAEFASRASDHDPQVVRLGIKGNAKKD